MSSADPPAAGDYEDIGAQVAPIITTGEKDEHAILDLQSKLYRFDKNGNQWKERGTGTVKFLKHKDTGKVRLLMRQSKTLKICVDHLILPSMNVREHDGNEKSYVWLVWGSSDGKPNYERFRIQFSSIENCKSFMKLFLEVVEDQKVLPSDLIYAEILTRLSVKELLRFKCVKKDWESIISSVGFIKLHHLKSTMDPTLTHHRMIVTSGPGSTLSQARSSLKSIFTESRPAPKKMDSRINCEIVGTARGLLCLRNTESGHVFFCGILPQGYYPLKNVLYFLLRGIVQCLVVLGIVT